MPRATHIALLRKAMREVMIKNAGSSIGVSAPLSLYFRTQQFIVLGISFLIIIVPTPWNYGDNKMI